MGFQKRKKATSVNEEDNHGEDVILEPQAKRPKKKHQQVIEAEENGRESGSEDDEESAPKKSQKKKKKGRSEADDEPDNGIEYEPETKKSKKKKRRSETNGVVEPETLDDHSNEEELEPETKKSKKKKKKSRQNGEEVISDIEDHYLRAIRAKVDEDKQIIPLSGSLARLETKVFEISEDEWNEKDPMDMPSQGVLTRDGVPFHHAHPYPLQKHHTRRLFAHGINLRTSPFSPGEDEQIIENWRRFAKKNNIDFEDAPLYCGWAKHLGHRLQTTLTSFHNKTKFYPYMCRNLIDRCAIQVYRRCYRIFDPKSDEFGRNREQPWTEEDEEELMRLFELEGNAWQKIAVKLHRNRFQVQTHYERVILKKEVQRSAQYKNTKAMYIREDRRRILIYEHAKDCLPAHPVQLVTKGIGEREDRNINWRRLCKKYPVLTEATCTEEWTKIKAQLRAAYNRANDPSVTFETVEQSVFEDYKKPGHRLTTQIAMKSFKIMAQLAFESDVSELYEIDTVELTNRLKAAEISFRTSYTVGSHILRVAHDILRKLRQHGFLQILPFNCTIVDLIKMLAYFMKKSTARVRRLTEKDCYKLIHRYLRHKKWAPNPKYTLISKAQLEALQELSDSDGEDDVSEEDEIDESQNQDTEKSGKEVSDEDVDDSSDVEQVNGAGESENSDED